MTAALIVAVLASALALLAVYDAAWPSVCQCGRRRSSLATLCELCDREGR